MKLTNCAEALRRHHFEAETVKDTTEAFAVLKAIAERERPEIVSFGDSETMHATGIVGWLRGDGRWKLLDGFDPRDELSRTVGDTPAGADVRPLHHGSQRHQHGRLAPLARQGGQPHRPGGVRAPQGGHRSRTQQDRRRPCPGRGSHPHDRRTAKTSHGTRGSARRAPGRAYARTATRPTACATRVWRCCGAGPQGACWSC